MPIQCCTVVTLIVRGIDCLFLWLNTFCVLFWSGLLWTNKQETDLCRLTMLLMIFRHIVLDFVLAIHLLATIPRVRMLPCCCVCLLFGYVFFIVSISLEMFALSKGLSGSTCPSQVHPVKKWFYISLFYLLFRMLYTTQQRGQGEAPPNLTSATENVTLQQITVVPSIPPTIPSENAVGTCSICLEIYTEPLRCFKCPGRHVFHQNCIERWIQESLSCPICRHVPPI
jgi:hypothetical protein